MSTLVSRILCGYISLLQAVVCFGATMTTVADTATTGDPFVEAQNAVQQGRNLYKDGKYPESLEQYERALERFRAASNLQGEADVISDIAIVYRKLGDLDQSLALQQRAAKIYEDIGDIRGQARALRRIGVLYHHRGKLFQAIAAQEEALELMNKANDQEGIATVFTNLGTIYGDLGRFQDARSDFERALQIYTQLQNQEGVSYTLGDLGQLFLYLGDSQQALQYLDQSLAIKRTLSDTRGEANTLLNTGTAYKNLGDFQKALTFYYKALDIYKQLNDLYGEAATLGSIGSTYEELGDLDQALEFQLQSLDFKKLSGTPLQLTIALANLASLAIKQRHFSEADTYLQEGLNIAVEYGSKLAQANIYGQIGLLHLNQDLFEDALQNFTRSLDLYEEIGSQKGMLEVFEYLGQIYIKQDLFKEALPYYERAFRLARALNDINALWTVQYRLGQIFLASGDEALALEHFQASVEALEQMRSYLNVSELRQLFLRKDLNPYVQMIRLLLRQQNIKAALLYLERFKARTFLELVAHGEPQLLMGSALLQEEQYVSARISYLSAKLVDSFGRSETVGRDLSIQPEEGMETFKDIEQELHNAKEHYEQLLLRIKLQHPEYYRLKTVDAEEIQQFINKAIALVENDIVMVEYFLDDTAIHIWIIEQNQIHHTSVPISSKDVIEKVLTFRFDIRWYESNKIYAPLQALYTWLITPVEPYLAGKTIIGIIPFQILHFVPFSALISPSSNGVPNYLIETYGIFSLPSLSMLPVVRDRSIQNIEKAKMSPRYYFLGIGNATEDLPGANEEIQTIINQFPNSKGYTGIEATKQRLFEDEAKNFEIVHLATHGVYDKQHPMFSYLEFAPESHLYAGEIFGLHLWANLVTLSGCETLLPEQIGTEDMQALVSGDELVGFIRAFMYAGTPSVLSSLWRVSDQATQYLMNAFYQKLPYVGKVKALQQACQSVIRTTIQIGRHKKREIPLTHPFFWSSFVLIGDWK
jgi:CHAT domain-containing protein/uncharacterized protein HemY